MPDLLDVYVYYEVQNGATAAEIAALLDVPQRQVWERIEAARFSAELRELRESVEETRPGPFSEMAAICATHK